VLSDDQPMLIVTTRIEPKIACGAGDGIRVRRQKTPIPNATKIRATASYLSSRLISSTTESRLSFVGHLEKPEECKRPLHLA
jgi:hypothetical protein